MTVLAIILGLVCAWLTVTWRLERARRKRAGEAHASYRAGWQAAHEASLRDHVRQNQAVIDSMVEGVVVLDPQHRVVLANRAAAAMFGFPWPAAGRTLLETVRHHEVAALIERLTQESRVIGHEIRIEGAQPLLVQVNAAALRDGAGAPSGVVLVFHDLTRMRELEGVRQDFVANVSHELRTPLSLIKGAVETLLDGAKNDPAALTKLLDIIDRHADRLTRLIDDLLLLAKLDSGRMPLHVQVLGLRPLVQEVMDDLGSRAADRQMLLESTLTDGLTTRADPDRLRQVLSNLIDNAIKYGRAAGRIVISGQAIDEGWLEVRVHDDGPGIPPETQARVFERFYRIDKARSRDQGGTGLGLAIVKHVVQTHGGKVRVESSPGQGTAFIITLPRT